ncbi:MAG: ATP-binding protein [Poseidonibacter sp.]|uniref:ATP-binding protein n=1 Tax=Poseidonibacter sp. TaxID=2321188 RepID=UPI00359D5653
MKLTNKIIIPLVFIVTLLFSLLMIFFLNSEKKIIKDAQVRNSKKIIEQFEKDKNDRLEYEKQNIEFLAKMISRISAQYVYDFDIENISLSLEEFLEVENIKAIEVFEKSNNEVFSALYKDKNKNLKDKYKFIEKDIIWGNSSMILGFVKVYYDDTLIISQFKKSKEELFEKLKANNLKQQEQLDNVVFNQIIFLISIAIILFILVFYMTYKTVLKPLKILNTGLDSFFMFLQNKTDNTNRIEINTNDEFGSMAKSLNDNIAVSARLHEEIHELNNNLEEKILLRTKQLDEKTNKVEVLLNNADQGFLSFGSDLLIDSEYSLECKNIFKKEISNIAIGELLYKEDENKREFFEETLRSLLNETNELKIKNIISLLQKEFIINKKAISVKYKIIQDSRYMLIFTDITANKILQKKINKEKDTLKMIVSVISDSEEFFDLIDEFNNFVQNRQKSIDLNKTALHNTTTLYRTIHTFKGLFAQKDMQFMLKNLHALENQLSKLLSNQDNTNEHLLNLLNNTDFNSWLAKELDVIKSILGDELFNKKGKIVVKEDTISKIEEDLSKIANKSNLMHEYKRVIDDIKNLKNKPIYTMFNSYAKLVNQVSTQLKKSIYPLEIIADKNILVQDKIKPFIKSLVHVFRNSVDHGIETLDERYEIGKDEIGTISCSIFQKEDNLHIIIADDGKGLDIQKIEEKAQQMGIDTSSLNTEQVYKLIFNDKLSTNDEITTLSGRGVGMSVVKYEIEKLNGEINISSQVNIGTTFEFIIPT